MFCQLVCSPSRENSIKSIKNIKKLFDHFWHEVFQCFVTLSPKSVAVHSWTRWTESLQREAFVTGTLSTGSLLSLIVIRNIFPDEIRRHWSSNVSSVTIWVSGFSFHCTGRVNHQSYTNTNCSIPLRTQAPRDDTYCCRNSLALMPCLKTSKTLSGVIFLPPQPLIDEHQAWRWWRGRQLITSVSTSHPVRTAWSLCQFLSDPGEPGVRSLGPDVRPSVSLRPCWDLTDVTLANEDTKSIPTANAKRAFKGNVAMHVRQPGGQLWNQC